MIDFGESFGLFFVIELADGFGGVTKSGIVYVDNNLRNNGGDFTVLVFLSEGVMDGLSEPIADLSLTHCDGSFERHSGGFVGRGLFFVNEDVTDLRAITVSDDNFVFVS